MYYRKWSCREEAPLALKAQMRCVLRLTQQKEAVEEKKVEVSF